jgi:hypothetical protein
MIELIGIFLESAMRKLGFAKTWVDWIMTCIKSAQLSVRFNGKLLKKFTPTRGLRQGDPLSPYLFHFVAKGQSCLLYRQIELRNIQELMICRRSPGISHLLFADGCLLFLNAYEDQANRINNVLRDYEKSTGQQLNPTKCSLMLGQHCSEQNGEIVASILRVVSTSFDDKYLGPPIPEGRMKDEKFQPTKDFFFKEML